MYCLLFIDNKKRYTKCRSRHMLLRFNVAAVFRATKSVTDCSSEESIGLCHVQDRQLGVVKVRYCFL